MTAGPALAGPPAHAARPAWTVPIAAWTRSLASDGGTVLSRDPAGHVVLVDPRSGVVRWRSAEVTRREQDGPWLTRIDGVPVAVVLDRTVLSYWRLPGAGQAAGGGPAVGVRLPRGAVVTWAGAAPLVTWAGGAGVIQGGAVRPVSLPRRGRALAADGTSVLAVAGAGYVRQALGRRAARLRALPRPRGAGSRPLRVEAVGTAYLLAVWPRTSGGGHVVGLVDVASGRPVVQTAADASLNAARGALVREPGGTQTLVGSVLVDTYTASLSLLDPKYTVRTVTRGHAWAVSAGRATDIHLNRAGDFRTVPFPTGDPALPVGVVAGGSRGGATAVVVAPFEGGWVLCGLPETREAP